MRGIIFERLFYNVRSYVRGGLYSVRTDVSPPQFPSQSKETAMTTTLLPPRRSTDAKTIAGEIREQHRLTNVAKAELLELLSLIHI